MAKKESKIIVQYSQDVCMAVLSYSVNNQNLKILGQGKNWFKLKESGLVLVGFPVTLDIIVRTLGDNKTEIYYSGTNAGAGPINSKRINDVITNVHDLVLMKLREMGEIERNISTAIEKGLLCPNCGNPLNPGAKFCPDCGTKITNRCPSCEHENTPDAKFCQNCGEKL